MLFNSLEFMLFLPTVFLLYWFVFGKRLLLQNLFIVVVSYIFYSWWDWRFLFLIAITSFTTWLSGVWMEVPHLDEKGAAVTERRRKVITGLNAAFNFLILGCLKYYNFFADSFAQAFTSVGVEIHPFLLHVILPVGISFHSFVCVSYSVDVYRGTIKPARDIVSFLAYVSFFPLLVAGPIERATNLLPQFLAPRTFSYPLAVDGCRQMLWGFFKKMVVADNCADVVKRVFDNYQDMPAGSLLVGALFFAVQIYGDFSGYSDIAVGCSRLFGIRLMRNFAYPYFARDISEFWRKWHISLTTWFRDYLYFPLGGSRCSAAKITRNAATVFLTSGLWHGANWTYVAWGGIHAGLYLPLLLGQRNRTHLDSVAAGRMLPSFREFWQMGTTFLLVVVTWVFFRASTFSAAIDILWRILTLSGGLVPKGTGGFHLMVPGIILLFATEWVARTRLHGLEAMPKSKALRWLIYLALAGLILFFRGDQQIFIYFQF